MAFSIAPSSSHASETLMPSVPHDAANSAKFGFLSEVDQTSKRAFACSKEIFASSELLKTTHFIGILYLETVVQSARYWANPPSPATAKTFEFLNSPSSFVAQYAPIAAGSPTPIEPR